MASAQVVETSFTNNSPSQDSSHPETEKLNKKRTQSYAPHKHLSIYVLLQLNMDILGRGLSTFSNKTERGHWFFHFNDRGSKVLIGIDDQSCQPTLGHK